MNRRYVDVVCLNDKNGNLKPLYLLWDDIKKYQILKIKEVCPRASININNSGLRYTCIFESNITRHLYFDKGKWFVEVKDNVI